MPYQVFTSSSGATPVTISCTFSASARSAGAMAAILSRQAWASASFAAAPLARFASAAASFMAAFSSADHVSLLLLAMGDTFHRALLTRYRALFYGGREGATAPSRRPTLA